GLPGADVGACRQLYRDVLAGEGGEVLRALDHLLDADHRRLLVDWHVLHGRRLELLDGALEDEGRFRFRFSAFGVCHDALPLDGSVPYRQRHSIELRTARSRRRDLAASRHGIKIAVAARSSVCSTPPASRCPLWVRQRAASRTSHCRRRAKSQIAAPGSPFAYPRLIETAPDHGTLDRKPSVEGESPPVIHNV